MAVTSVVLAVAVFLSCAYPVKYDFEIAEACREFGVEESLVRGVIRTESRFRRDAVSRAGAVGLMQLMPSTAKWLATEMGEPNLSCDLCDPYSNVRLGTAYLKYLLGKFELRDALAAYNAGEGNVARWKSLNLEEYPFAETRDYVKKVLRAKKVYSSVRKRG